ncbi:hypothetical protein K490DRAFT_57558 [Saccharata proteae CBS 121410]|uniref:DUF7626 domain-containing protein n=1 Tax=Saccharata proteae CBS 121410 TaxID=1314787 RepID=A0A9P4HV71_9PEZI|nr:hypothetical protein K490DRAFT_57558 [Saccharata proteae CBS 121410]
MSDSFKKRAERMSRGTLFTGPKPGQPYRPGDDSSQPDDSEDEDYTFFDSDGEDEQGGASSQEEYEEIHQSYLLGADKKVPQRRHRRKKPVTIDLDQTDTILVRMKQEGATDKEVARALEDIGATYSEKSVATRFRRIMVKKKKDYDKQFIAGARTWTGEEDDQLLWANEEAEHQMAVDIQRIHNRQFNYVEKMLAKRIPYDFISAASCRERLAELHWDDPGYHPASRRRFDLQLFPVDARRQYQNELQSQVAREKVHETNIIADVKALSKEYKRILAMEAADEDW